MICENCTIVELAAARFKSQARRPAVILAVQLCPLHAAAPDLLAALERISVLAEYYKGVFQVDWDVGESWLTADFHQAIKHARAAIAAAKEAK